MHIEMEKYIEELHVESRMILENIPEAELVFTAEEITTLAWSGSRLQTELRDPTLYSRYGYSIEMYLDFITWFILNYAVTFSVMP